MRDRSYQWKRFLADRGQGISLADGGFMYDPDSEWGRLYNPNALAVEDARRMQNLVLLGPPGSGKSHLLRTEINAARQTDKRVFDVPDLRSFGSEDRFVSEIFGSSEIRDWQRGTHCLQMFIDSLDECLIRMGNMTMVLLEQLRKCPCDRLSLWIACRTGAWPASLERGLIDLWGEDSVRVMELTPLRRCDVVTAAESRTLDSEEFLHDVEFAGAVPFAIYPNTLEFLLRMYDSHHTLPRDAAELYRSGCLCLCQETDEMRADVHYVTSLNLEQRLAGAMRIAACTVFGNRGGVWTGSSRDGAPSEYIWLDDLCGGYEGTGSSRVQLDRRTLMEMLSTGLFTSRGPNRLGWAHQTYAEFLAAQFLVDHNVAVRNILSMIQCSADLGSRLIPKLQDTGAWLACQSSGVFDEVVKADPCALIAGGAATFKEEQRKALVDGVLHTIRDEGDVFDYSQPQLGKLAWSGLAAQLRAYIADSDEDLDVRRKAIEIAGLCGLTELDTTIADVALDHREPYRLRIKAASVVKSIGSDEARAFLKPLALEELRLGPYLDNQLKGYALMAVWPHCLSVRELFQTLTPPRIDEFIDSYHMFLSYEVTPGIHPDDLPVALSWVMEQDSQDQMPRSFTKLCNDIIAASWEYSHSAAVMQLLAGIAFHRASRYEPLVGGDNRFDFQARLRADQQIRRALLRGILPLVVEGERDPGILTYYESPLVISEDFEYVLTELEHEEDQAVQACLARLAMNLLDRSDPDHVRLIREAKERGLPFSEFLAPVRPAASVGTTEVSRQTRKGSSEPKAAQDDVVEPASHMNHLGDPFCAFEEETREEWARFSAGISGWLVDNDPGLKAFSRVAKIPGWEGIGAVARRKIIVSATRYLVQTKPVGHAIQLSANGVSDTAIAGWRALALLSDVHDGDLERLPEDVWRSWADILAGYPLVMVDDTHTDAVLVEQAYRHARGELIRALAARVSRAKNLEDHSILRRRIGYCWDEDMEDALLKMVSGEGATLEAVELAFSILIKNDCVEAYSIAETVLNSSEPGSDSAKAVIAGKALLCYGKDRGWSTVWPVMKASSQLGCRLLEETLCSSDHGRLPWEGSLSERRLGEFYRWLQCQYPPQEYALPLGAHYSDIKDKITELRDSIPRLIADRGTRDAYDELSLLAKEFPGSRHLKWATEQARRIAAAGAWHSLRPTEILAVVERPEARLVQTGNDLLDVICDSLRRLQLDLQGEPAAARFLWDKCDSQNGTVYRPKDEAHLRDFIKLHLERDLVNRRVVTNREVQIRPGEIVDLLVNAVGCSAGQDEQQVVSVAVEVKGCWNDSLMNAMKNQLVDRYLKDTECTHGVYAVGWFNCSQWQDDYRKAKSAKYTNICELGETLSAQARDLSQQAHVKVEAFVLDVALRGTP